MVINTENPNVTYLYLDLDDKLNHSLLQNEYFLKIVNLHKPNPLIQINELLFKGTLENVCGTNIFLEEIDEVSPKTNLFDKNTPIELKHFLSQTKIMKLKLIKLPRKVTEKDPNDTLSMNLDQNYKDVLNLLEQDKLDFENLFKPKPPPVLETPQDIVVKESSESISEEASNNSKANQIGDKYARLKELAKQPTKRSANLLK